MLRARSRFVGLLICLSGVGLAGAAVPATAAAACDQEIDLPLVTATTSGSGCFTENPSNSEQFTTSSPVTLNGVTVPPVPGTSVTINEPSSSAPGGSISVTASITVAGFTLQKQVISKNFPNGSNGQEGAFVGLAPSGSQKFLGLELTGSSVAWNFGRDSNGTPFSKFAAVLALPSILKNGPGATAGGLTGTVAFRVNQNGALKTDAVKLEIANAYMGPLQVKNLCLSYTAAGSSTTPCSPPPFGGSQPLITCEQGAPANRWDGSALMVLPTSTRPELGLFAGFRDGQFGYGGAQVSNLGNALPIATNIYLDRFGLGVCVNPPPFKIKGAVGIRFGPGNFADLGGSLEYTGGNPWQIKADGTLDIAGTRIGEGHIKYLSSGDIDFAVSAAINIASIFKADGSLSGWYQSSSKRFDIFGTGKVCITAIPGGCLGGDVAVSNVGVAGCVKIGGFKAADLAAADAVVGAPQAHIAWSIGGFFRSVGNAIVSTGQKVVGAVKQFGNQVVAAAKSVGQAVVNIVQNGLKIGAGYRWHGSVSIMATSCDVGPYRAQKAAVVAAGAPKAINLPKGPGVVLRFKGLRTPPKFELVSPGGKDVIVANKTGRFVPGEYIYAENPKDHSTVVTIPDPLPGAWKIKVFKGSPPIVGESMAKIELPPMVTGEVVGQGHSRTLDYIDERHPGETLQLWERGLRDNKLIGTATGPVCPKLSIKPVPAGDSLHPNCGKIRFSPGPGPAGLRRIVAVVMRSGEPVQEIEVAKYHAPGEVPLEAPGRVSIQRNGTTVGVTWLKVEGARTYDILYKLNDGEQQIAVAEGNASHIVLPEAINPADNITVTVRAVKSSELQGPGKQATSQGDTAAGPPLPEGA